MGADPRRRALCRRVDIAAEIGRWVEVRRSEEHFRCACPRHDDDPTFPLYIHPGKRVFTCFGCGFSGDVVDFFAEVRKVTVAEAMQALCDSLGLDPERLTEETRQDGGAAPSESPETRLAGLALEAAARRFKLSPDELRAALLETDSSATDSATTAPAEPAGCAERRPHGQEERDSERAAITSADNLLLAWRKVKTYAAEHDVYFDSALFALYEERLEANLQVLRRRLVRLAGEGEPYEPEPFRLLRLTKPKGGFRELAVIARVEDRIVIQAVMNVLAPPIEKGFSPNSYGHRLPAHFEMNDLVFQRWPELWGSYRAKLQKFLWTPEDCAYIKGDLATFYDSVDRTRLYDLLSDHAADDWTLLTVKNYLHYRLLLDDGSTVASGPCGLPQGPAYAHFLANLYLDEFDRFVEQELAADQDNLVEQETLRFMEWLDQAFNMTLKRQPRAPRGRQRGRGYCRYVDDFFILFRSRDEATQGREEIKGKLAGWGLALSEKKTDIYDHENVEPVVHELKSRKYTVGKLLDHDETLDVAQREMLYEVVEHDFLTIAEGEDPGKAAENISFVVNKLSESTFFKRTQQALLHLVIELLFSQSVKHSVIGGLLKKTLPQIVSTHYAAEFAEHLRHSGTPAFKRVLFLRAVQDNRFYADLGAELQDCVLEFLADPCFFVRFAAANCLWANGHRLPLAEVRRHYDKKEHPAIRARLLHLVQVEGADAGRTATFLEKRAGDDRETGYHALVVARRTHPALARVVPNVQADEGMLLVEWLVGILCSGNRRAVESLGRYLDGIDNRPQQVEETYRVILGQVRQLCETGEVTRTALLELMDNLKHLSSARLRDLLVERWVVPSGEFLLTTEDDEESREQLAAWREKALKKGRSLPEEGIDVPGSQPVDVGFLNGVGVTYRARQGPNGVLDLWETIETRQLKERGRFDSAYAWEEYLQRARQRGLTDFEECSFERNSKEEPVAVRVHYRVGPEYRRLADSITEQVLDEHAAAAVVSATAKVHTALRKLAPKQGFAPTITSYHVVADISHQVKFIALGSALGRPRYVTLKPESRWEDSQHWDSLFLGWLAFELVTGHCPLTELKELATAGSEKRFLTLSPRLAGLSIYFTRVLKRLTYEWAEYRTPLGAGQTQRLLAEYRRNLRQFKTLEQSGGTPEDLLADQLLTFWDQRVQDAWHNPSFARDNVAGRILHAYSEAMADAATFCARTGLLFGELPSSDELPAGGLHLVSAGVDRGLRRVEEMQSQASQLAQRALPLRINVCMMHIVLRGEATACAAALRMRHWERWRQSPLAGQLLRGGETAAYLAEFLRRHDARLAEILRKEALEPLALDLTILTGKKEEDYVPFEKCGLAALGAVCLLLEGEGEGADESRELLYRLVAWEHRAATYLGDPDRLTLEVYHSLADEQRALVELLHQAVAGRERLVGKLTDNLGPCTSRPVAVEVDGLPAPVEAERRAILALAPLHSPDRNLAKGETVSVDVVDGKCVALSHLGVLERQLFAAPAERSAGQGQEPAPPTEDGAAAAVDEPPHQFYKGKNGLWAVRYEGRQLESIEDLDGMFYLWVLLQHPDGEPVSCLEMRSLLLPAPPPQHADYYTNLSDEMLAGEGLFVQVERGQEVVDRQALREVQSRLRTYQREYDELKRAGRAAEAAQVWESQLQLKEWLNDALGLGGKPRRRSKRLESARTTVKSRIGLALKKIEAQDRGLYRHLVAHIDTGTACTYTPEPLVSWETVREC